MVRGCARRLIVLMGMWCLASTVQGEQSPGKPNGRAGDKAPLISGGADTTSSCPALTRIRFYPRKGFAQRMFKGRFSGSNAGKTTDFWTVAEIKETPPEGQWTEIQLAKPVRFRYLKYESPVGGWGNVAEVEFYSGDKKIQGTAFGTTGSRGRKRQRFLQGPGRQRGNLLRRRGAEQPVRRHRPGAGGPGGGAASSRPSQAPISLRRRSRSPRPRRVPRSALPVTGARPAPE